MVNLDEGDSVVDVARLVSEDENGNSQDEELTETLDSAEVGDSD